MPQAEPTGALSRWRMRTLRSLRLRSEHVVLLWAALAGFLGALAVIGFREGIHGLQYLISGSSGSMVAMARAMPWPARIALPAAGGLIAGLLLAAVRRREDEAASDYMESISTHGGHVPVRASLLRSASSLFTVASGGSIGREGSMVQLAALGASLLGRALGLDAATLRLLVACGAAAGISAAYNAPVAGVFFVGEVVLGSVLLQNFGPMVVASVVANVTMREFPGFAPTYRLPDFPELSALPLVACLALGAIAGLLAPLFLRLLQVSREGFRRTGLPLPLRLALGGLAVGMLSVGFPEVWGNGYSVVNALLHEPWAWQTVLAVLVAKVVATAFTSGSGAVGGVFTPTLFVGAASGYLFGVVVQAVAPAFAAPPFAFAVVGMSAFLAGATGAPFMAIVMIFEMTLSYAAMLPLMLAAVLAHLVARSLGMASMYAITVAREASQAERERLRDTRMRELIRPTATVADAAASETELAQLFLRLPTKFLYVVDGERRLLGAVPLSAVMSTLVEPGVEHPSRTARELLQPDFPVLTADMSLAEALGIFLGHAGERLPVIESVDDRHLLGVIHKSSLLDTYARLTDDDD